MPEPGRTHTLRGMPQKQWTAILAAERLLGATTVKLEHDAERDKEAKDKTGYWSSTVAIEGVERWFANDRRWTHATFYTLKKGEIAW